MRAALLIAVLAAGCGHSESPPKTDAPNAAGDTWTSWAQSFTATYCAATCHASNGSATGGGMYDFTKYTNVYAVRAIIRCGVAPVAEPGCTGNPPPKQFPIAAPYPSDTDRARMVAWIDSGAPQ